MQILTQHPEEYVTQLEKSLMLGKGRWVAEFYESFRNKEIGGITFDAFLRGNTSMKGFLLSRLYSFFLNPNYEVACFIMSRAATQRTDISLFNRFLNAIRERIREENMKWGWFVIVTAGKHQELVDYASRVRDTQIGVLVVDSISKQSVHSDNFLGKQIRKYVKL